MTLTIESLQFRDFRNYEQLSLEGFGRLNVFVGCNAVGKTNILEGIGMLTAHRSLRNAATPELVRAGAGACSVDARLEDGLRHLDLRFAVSEGRRRFELNGKAKRTADLKGLLPSVSFIPDDLQLVKGADAGRRAELDSFGSQLSKNHYVIKRDFENVLKAKNRLLREEADALLVESTNEVLVTCGAQLCCYRAALVRKMEPYLGEAYREISGGKERLSVFYLPSWEAFGSEPDYDGADASQPGREGTAALARDDARAALRRALERILARERAAKHCLMGPHRDKMGFLLDGRDASRFASQGQQRSIVLALKLTELLVMRDMLNLAPILILDDVMSELDAARRAKLVCAIQQDMQVFLSATSEDCLAPASLDDACIIRLPKEGR